MIRLRMDLGRWGRPVRFVAVGATSTIAYGVLAMLGSMATSWPASIVSLFAYLATGVLSYHGHRMLTFTVKGVHGVTPLRFAALGAFGYAMAFAAPALLTDTLGYPPAIAIGFTCVAVPLFNALAMARFVFRAPLLDPPRRRFAPPTSETSK